MDGGSTVKYVYDAFGLQVDSVAAGPVYRETYYDAFGGRAVSQNHTTTLEDFFPPVAGRNYVKFAAGATLFMHTTAQGTTGIVTAQDDSAWQDQVYYPLGQQWVPLNSGYDVRFGSMEERDAVTGLDPTPARQYNNNLGRWMSPDPLAGDITNPQSLNRYAYALNNPTTLTDPRGLDATNWCGATEGGSCPDRNFPGAYDPYAVVGPGGQQISTGSMLGYTSPDMAQGEAQYLANNCINCVWAVWGNSSQEYAQQFASLDDYYNWVTDPNGGEPLLAAYNAYKQFADEFPYLENAAPNALYQVQGQRRGFTPNYQANGLWQDLRAVAAADPAFDTFGHGGNPSWRIDLGWDSQLHSLDVYNAYSQGQWFGAEWHEEFPTWNPVHWADWVASQVIPNSGWSQFVCSLNAGCAPR